jgi:hypothetical protein
MAVRSRHYAYATALWTRRAGKAERRLGTSLHSTLAVTMVDSPRSTRRTGLPSHRILLWGIARGNDAHQGLRKRRRRVWGAARIPRRVNKVKVVGVCNGGIDFWNGC